MEERRLLGSRLTGRSDGGYDEIVEVQVVGRYECLCY